MATKNRRHTANSQISSPYGPIAMAQVGFLESRHLHPERLPSGRKEKIVSLRLVDASTNAISNVRNLSASIRRLNASSLHLKTVPEDLVGSLLSLTKLDLSNNRLGDASFPDCMTKLRELVDVRLSGNYLTKVPVCVKKLKHLKRLDLGENQIVSSNGLEKLRRLQILVLDKNKLTTVFRDICTLRRLEVLRCAGNCIREISRDIGQLRSLVDLDLSENRISTLPADIFMLPKLDVFAASNNEVSKVPSFNIRPQNMHWITHIDLSDNKLSKFPGHLLLMTFKLDLSNNKIRSLPYHQIKKLDIKTDQQLLMKDNPLIYPPSDICDSGLKSIVSFFQEKASEVKVYQGVKVFVLGHHRSGKTSFVQTLVDQLPRLSEDVQDMSGGIDIYSMTLEQEEEVHVGNPGKSLELNIWDFCGHPFYMYPHHIFFEHPSVTILNFNMAEYTDDKFVDLIGFWIDWMLVKTNKLVIVLVGTHCDLLSESQTVKVSRDVRTSLARHLDRQTEFIKNQIRIIEERPHISPTLSEHLKNYMRLLQTKTTVLTDVIYTSSKLFVGFDKVRQALETVTEDRTLFPNVMRVIPTFWLDVLRYVEDRGNAMSFPVMTWQEFEEEVTSRYGMKHLIKSIAQYLHETGQILWFSNVPTLKGLVIIRPSWLFDVLRLMLRHDFGNSAFVLEDHTRSADLSTMKFERLKGEALSDGVLDRDLFRCILAPLVSPDNASLTTDVMKLLSEGFELGHSTSLTQKESAGQLVANKESKETRKQTNILVPWLRRNSEPEEFSSKWAGLKNSRKLVCVFKFPLYLPSGLFEVMCVRAHSEKHKLRFVHQWGGGLYATHTDTHIHVLVTYYQSSDEQCDENSMFLKFEVRDEVTNRNEDAATTTLWNILLPLLMDFEQLLSSYAGIVVERLMECPLCQMNSFMGEWLTPKETQASSTRTCETCHQEVDTAFLVQPKEQKRVIIKRKNSTCLRQLLPPSPLPKLPTLPEENHIDFAESVKDI